MKNFSAKTKSSRLRLLILLFTLLILPISSLAYTETTSGGQLLAEVYPESPGPFTEVSIKLISYEIDLTKSNINWAVNGKDTGETGIGKTRFKTKTEEIGRQTSVEISIVSPDGKTLKKNLSFSPAEVDIIWQTDGYTPPFYKGKSLPTLGGKTRILAVPNFLSEDGIKIDPSKLTYNWRISGGQSNIGLGKRKIAAQVNDPTGNIIFLEVVSPDGRISASKTVLVRPMSESVIFYEDKPLLGTQYERGMTTLLKMNDREIALRAEPYFMTGGNIEYSWSLNDQPFDSTANGGNKVVLRKLPNTGGEADLNVLVNSRIKNITDGRLIIRFHNSLEF